MNPTLHVLFLFQTAEHVRFCKRVELLMHKGITAEVLAFERQAYPGKSINCKYSSLGVIKHQNYCKRIIPFISALKKIRAGAKNNDLVYAFGLDMLLLGWIVTLGISKGLVYEVGDIREVLLGQGLKHKFFRLLERFLLNRTSLLVITSKAYLDEYYYKIQGLSRINHIVIENKLDRNWLINLAPKEKETEGSSGLIIGYFGVLRCMRSWEILKTAAEKSGGVFQVYLRGISRDINLQVEANHELVTYAGPYLAPDDLPAIYGKVNLVWACYPYQGNKAGNWQWAKTVRFYESCYFKKPLIVQAGTEDSKLVEKYDLGLIVDMNEGVEKVVHQVLAITRSDLERWKKNMDNVPPEVYLYTDEHDRLAELLQTQAEVGR